MAGFEVCPRSASSRTRRSSSAPWVIQRRIWSSHTLVPAAVIAARRSLVVAPVAMRSGPFQVGVQSVVLHALHLAEAAHVALLAGEARAREGGDELGRDRGADHARADAEDIAVVVADALLGRVVVVRDGGAHVRQLAGGNRHAGAAAADEDPA